MHSNSYKHPHRGVVGTMVEWVVNSRRFAAVRRSLLSRLPFLQLQSDVFDVVYLTWLVPVASTRIYSPDSIELWQRNGLTPFTILTYRHKHFGPAMLGPFRQLFPSPHQSNWRFYLRNAPPGAPDDRTVLFTHNVLSSLPYVLGARTMSDVLPAYLPARFIHRKARSPTRLKSSRVPEARLPFPRRYALPTYPACRRRSRKFSTIGTRLSVSWHCRMRLS
jgi:hypothetical protein